MHRQYQLQPQAHPHTVELILISEKLAQMTRKKKNQNHTQGRIRAVFLKQVKMKRKSLNRIIELTLVMSQESMTKRIKKNLHHQNEHPHD